MTKDPNKSLNGHASAVTTGEEQRKSASGRPFPKGVSGNPAGRPKSSRHKLEESFLEAIFDDFQEHGIEAIKRCRQERPDAYVTMIVRVLPRHTNLDLTPQKTHEEMLAELE